MKIKKIILKGSLHGTKNIKKYDKPDILYSKVDGYNFQKNELIINKNKDDSFYIYHSFESFDDKFNKINSGRWYNTNLFIQSFVINEKNKSITITLKNINWTSFKTGKSSIKNVKIILFLTIDGLNKVQKYLTSFSTK
jgi:hypothetical protein